MKIILLKQTNKIVKEKNSNYKNCRRLIISKILLALNHIEVLKVLKPQSVIELAEVLAIIRPAKRHLLNEDKATISEKVWEKPTDDSYYFKKAHAVAYAVSIVVQLNLFCEQVAQNGA